jgi:hypothetical protein
MRRWRSGQVLKLSAPRQPVAWRQTYPRLDQRLRIRNNRSHVPPPDICSNHHPPFAVFAADLVRSLGQVKACKLAQRDATSRLPRRIGRKRYRQVL